MLTVICPNCQHHFSSPGGCCEVSSDASSEKRNMAEAAAAEENKSIHGTACSRKTTQNCYTGGLLVPRGYTNDDNFTNGGGCYAPTIIQGPIVIQSDVHCGGSVVTIAGPEVTEFPYDVIRRSSVTVAAAAAANTYYPRLNDSMSVIVKTKNAEFGTKDVECADDSVSLPFIKQQRVATTYDLTGGNVMITTHTPRIQSGGCMIQNTDSEVLVQDLCAPHIEIRSKHTGGGCLIQRQLSTEDEQLTMLNATNILRATEDNGDHHRMFVNLAPTNGCAKLSGGTLLTLDAKSGESASTRPKQCTDNCCNHSTSRVHQQNLCQSHGELSNVVVTDNRSSTQIHVNVQLPANGGECRLNITTTQPGHVATATTRPLSRQIASTEPTRANCSARNSISTDDIDSIKNWSTLNGSNERRDGAPTTPVSWLMPYPWSVESGKFAEQTIRDPNRLREVKALLHVCGWYHEGISWQQSENLLKYAPIGCWLMRDSSDSRYTFAVSVQTTRGPTSIRIHQLFEGFRFDAKPSMTLPYFSCPIKLLEHYIKYSKKMDEKRKEVWVDYSGQIYSQIYLAQPLLKEVRPLSHLARLVVNQHKLRTEHLPLVVRNYIAEYPYTL